LIQVNIAVANFKPIFHINFATVERDGAASCHAHRQEPVIWHVPTRDIHKAALHRKVAGTRVVDSKLDLSSPNDPAVLDKNAPKPINANANRFGGFPLGVIDRNSSDTKWFKGDGRCMLSFQCLEATLRTRAEITWSILFSGCDGIVPVTVEVSRSEFEPCHFGIGDFEADGIRVGI